MQGVGINHMSSFLQDTAPAQPAQPVAPEAQITAPEPTPEPVVPPQPEPPAQPAPVQATTPPAEPEPTTETPQPEPESSAEPAPAAPVEPVQEPKPLEYTDEAILEHLKKTRNAEINSIDELFQNPEPVSDPLEGLSEAALQFVKYNKETGRGLEDFQELNRDYSKATPLQLARESAIKMANGTLNQGNVDQYLEKKLNIDLADLSNIDQFDMVELESFASPYRLKKIEEQAKYKQPIERPAPQAAEGQEELLTLENGARISKEQYQQILNQRTAYEESIKSATDKITSSAYQVKIDDNGTEKTIDVAYEYSKDDLHRMGSLAMDIDKAVTNLFGTKDGLDAAALQEGLLWADKSNREKMISSLVHKALAQQAKDLMKVSNNTNFNAKPIDNKQTNGKPLVIPGTAKNYGVKYQI